MVSALAAVVLTAAQLPGETIRTRTYIGSHDVNRYELLYGEPIYWSLSLIMEAVGEDAPPRNRAIRTRGLLSVMPRSNADPDVRLCAESPRRCLALDKPVPEIGAEFFADATFRQGHEAEVTGAYTDQGFLFWRIDSAARRPGQRTPFRDRRLEELVTQPARFLGRAVTVRGRFRGANLFDDFPRGARPSRDSWVLRDGPFFVWITHRPPKGEGWRLDTASPAECVWNVEVDGVAEQRGAILSVKAKAVRLLDRDKDASCAAEARR